MVQLTPTFFSYLKCDFYNFAESGCRLWIINLLPCPDMQGRCSSMNNNMACNCGFSILFKQADYHF